MLKHIVLYKFKEYAEGEEKAENIARCKVMMENLVGCVPSLLSLSAGVNVRKGVSAWDLALVAEFRDAEGLRQYVDHPEHKKVSEFVSKVRSERASVDFEF